MSNRHDEGFGSGFGFGYDPSLDWEGTHATRGGVFRDSFRGRRNHLDDEMNGAWNGFMGRGTTDRFQDRHVGYGHPYERTAGFYGHPYAANPFVSNAYGVNPYERNSAYGVNPYERNSAYGVNPYERNSAYGVNPYERNFAYGVNPYERTGIHTSPLAWERNTAFFGTPNAFAAQLGPQSMFGMNNPFATSNVFGIQNPFATSNVFGIQNPFATSSNFGAPNMFGTTPWERAIALQNAQSGMYNPAIAFGMQNPFAIQNAFGLQNTIGTPNVFGTMPWQTSMLGTPNTLFGTNNMLTNTLLNTPNALTNTLFGSNNMLANTLLGTNSSPFGSNNMLANTLLNTPNVFGTTPWERNLALSLLTTNGIGNVPNALSNTIANAILTTPNAFGTTPWERNLALSLLTTNNIGSNVLGSSAFGTTPNFGTPFVTPVERAIAERNLALFGTPFTGTFDRNVALASMTPFERNIALTGSPYGVSTTAFGHPYDRGFFAPNAGFSPREQTGFFGTEQSIQNDLHHGFGPRSTMFGGRGFVGQEGPFVDPMNPFWNTEAHAFHAESPFYGRGPKGYKRPDERIREEVAELIARQGIVDASDVEIVVENGIVRLVGSVAQRRDKRALEYVVERVHGVEEVRNELRLNHNIAEQRYQNRIVDRQVVAPHNGKNARA